MALVGEHDVGDRETRTLQGRNDLLGLRSREVHFRHARPRDASEHRRAFRAPVHFGMVENQIIFDPTVLATPIPNADPLLREVLISYAEKLLASTDANPTFLDAAADAIHRTMRAGDLRVARVASSLGVSVRTLQRRLVERGTSFRALVARIRLERARQDLRHSDASIAQIADRLGYGHPTELHRAFRTWTGTTPAEFRRTR